MYLCTLHRESEREGERKREGAHSKRRLRVLCQQPTSSTVVDYLSVCCLSVLHKIANEVALSFFTSLLGNNVVVAVITVIVIIVLSLHRYFFPSLSLSLPFPFDCSQDNLMRICLEV
jgi:hypothetical protein